MLTCRENNREPASVLLTVISTDQCKNRHVSTQGLHHQEVWWCDKNLVMEKAKHLDLNFHLEPDNKEGKNGVMYEKRQRESTII